jgi:hypothetical protein
MNWDNLIKILEERDEYTCPNGETWRLIAYPNFRKSKHPKANKWCSTFGRVLSSEGLTIDRRTEGDYQRTGICIHTKEGTRGGYTSDGVHRIIAFTFLSDTYQERYEVDHIDRNRWNNHVDNLRWVPPQRNINNRERMYFKAELKTLFSTIMVTGLKELCELVPGLYESNVRARISSTEIGDTITLGDDVELKVLEKVFQPLAHVDHPIEKKSTRKNPDDQAPKRVLRLYLDGHSLDAIATKRKRPIKVASVVAYIGEAAYGSTKSELEPLAVRLGVTDAATQLGLLDADIANLDAEHKNTRLDPKVYDERYRALVLHHFPQLGEEWVVMKAVRTTLMKQLSG